MRWERFETRAVRRYRAVAVMSEKDALMLGPAAQTTVIPNGVDLERFRPEPERSGDHPLGSVVDGLRIKRCCREINLSGMSEGEVAEYVAARVPSAPGQAQDLHRLALLVHRHTGGNPLFVLNVLDDLVSRGLLLRQDGKWALNMDLNMITLSTPVQNRLT